jgi:hypothetical protein
MFMRLMNDEKHDDMIHHLADAFTIKTALASAFGDNRTAMEFTSQGTGPDGTGVTGKQHQVVELPVLRQ